MFTSICMLLRSNPRLGQVSCLLSQHGQLFASYRNDATSFAYKVCTQSSWPHSCSLQYDHSKWERDATHWMQHFQTLPWCNGDGDVTYLHCVFNLYKPRPWVRHTVALECNKFGSQLVLKLDSQLDSQLDS